MLEKIRTFFATRDVLEVETPALSIAGSPAPHIESMAVPLADGTRYLHTSPEFPMKRLLASGSGDIYQICRVFRSGELGPRHNPEFTILEWYREGWSDRELLGEVEALVGDALAPHVDLAATDRLTYAEAFRRHAGLDPRHADVDACAAAAGRHDLELPEPVRKDDWLDLLMSTVVAPAFPPDRLTAILEYPASQAALARIRPDADGTPVAARFEVFLGEAELANGFHELTDAAEQRRRFQNELDLRAGSGGRPIPVDERFLAALEAGLPDCAGVALGLDRLVMIAAGETDLARVLAFPWGRA